MKFRSIRKARFHIFAPSGLFGCGSRSETRPQKSRKNAYVERGCHRSTHSSRYCPKERPSIMMSVSIFITITIIRVCGEVYTRNQRVDIKRRDKDSRLGYRAYADSSPYTNTFSLRWQWSNHHPWLLSKDNSVMTCKFNHSHVIIFAYFGLRNAKICYCLFQSLNARYHSIIIQMHYIPFSL